MESRADYIDPAKKTAERFKEYCVQECKESAAELNETTAQLCPPVPTRELDVGSLVQLNSAVLFCFVLFDLQLSVCLCWHLGTAAGTIPTRR